MRLVLSRGKIFAIGVTIHNTFLFWLNLAFLLMKDVVMSCIWPTTLINIP